MNATTKQPTDAEGPAPHERRRRLAALPFGSLRSTVLLLVALALVPAGIFIVAQTSARRAAALEQAEVEGSAWARSAAGEYSKLVSSTSVLLKTIAGLPEVRAFDGDSCRPVLVDVLAANPSFSNLGLVDSEGRRVCAAREGNTPMVLSDRPYFKETMKRNAFWVGEYQLGRATGDAVVNFAHPVRDAEGKARGVLYALIDLHTLVDATKRQSLPGRTILSLFDRRGTLLARSTSDRRWDGGADSWVADAIRALETEVEADLSTSDEGRAERQFVHRLEDGSGEPALYVSVTVPLATVTRPADEELRSGLWLLGAVALVTFGLAWLSSTALLVRPVRRLIDELKSLGDGELRAPGTPVASRGELGSLATAVERMVGGLQLRRTQRDRAMDALRKSEAGLCAALAVTQDGIFALDAAGEIRRVGPVVEETLGIDAEALVGTDFATSVLDPSCAEEFREALAAAEQDKAQPLLPARTEMRAVCGDGSSIPVELSCTRIAGDGAEEHTIYARDLSHEQELAAQFLEAQKLEAIGRLAAGVAHDFNNALTVINGYSQLLQTQLAADEGNGEIREYLQRIRHAGIQGAALVRRIMSFSRRQARAPRVHELNKRVGELMKLLPPLVGEDVVVKTELCPEPCPIVVDEGQFEQLAANLAVNARDAMPQGGTLTLRTRLLRHALEDGEAAQDCVAFELEDDGQGIEPETLKNIFKPFFSTKPEGKGTGLGLSSCREIMAQSDGLLEVESTLGEGTLMRAIFPLAGEGVRVSAPVGNGVEEPTFTSEDASILLVEDDPAVRDLAFHVLRQAGYTVARATDGEEALTMLETRKEEPFDLVLTDVIMPRLGGALLSESLAQSHPGLPVLLSSAYMSGPALNDALARENSAFLSKPYAPADLVRAVRRLLARARRSSEAPLQNESPPQGSDAT